MIEFGKTLREAREAKGYSVSQLAEITHILPQIIENLEKEDFTRIVAPIYGRGFVKLYCETVGLEPQPLVAEFMEIFNGNRPPVIRLKDVEAPAPAVSTAPEPMPMLSPAENAIPPTAPIAEEPTAVEEVSAAEPVVDTPAVPVPEPPSFNFDPLPEPPTAPEPPSCPVREPESFKPGPDDLPFPEDAYEPRRDYRLPGCSMPDVPRSFWRFGILFAAAAAILAILFFSCRAVYRATMQVPEEEARTEERKGETAPAASNAKPQTSNLKSQPITPRKGVPVPPLYID